MTTENFWQDFLVSTNKDINAQYFECFAFGMNEQTANELLELVLAGKKRATASSKSVYSLTNSRQPQVGDYSIVTDWAGNPRCVIETVAVTILPFNQITFDICKREGEDECLESWQQGHKEFFTAEGKEFGYEFSEDMEVIFEDFEVVYKQ